LSPPQHVAVASDGSLMIADPANEPIRKIARQ
jgi:glucose/arabinose dehydrogenase